MKYGKSYLRVIGREIDIEARYLLGSSAFKTYYKCKIYDKYKIIINIYYLGTE